MKKPVAVDVSRLLGFKLQPACPPPSAAGAKIGKAPVDAKIGKVTTVTLDAKIGKVTTVTLGAKIGKVDA